MITLCDMRFFSSGWGALERCDSMNTFARTVCQGLFDAESRRKMVADMDLRYVEASDRESTLRDGIFRSPAASFLPTIASDAHFRLVLPPSGAAPTAVCVQLPATADEGYRMRQLLSADSLARKGVASILLTAPFYGDRKPAAQLRHFVSTVEDVVLQSGAVAMEAALLLCWAKTEWPDAPQCVTGISWGGAMAGLASMLVPHPIAVVPYMGCSSPARVFSEGVIRHSVDWEALHRRDAPSDQAEECTAPTRAPVGDELETSARLREVLSRCANVGLWAAARPHIPQRAVVQVQCAHDHFVGYDDGMELYAELTQHHPPTDVSCRTLWGGHVTGFLVAAWYQTAAITSAISQLEKSK